MKILAISHSCVADVNQQLFVELNRFADVMLLMPAAWKNEYTGRTTPPRLLDAVTFPVLKAPVALAGQVSLHFYTRLPLKQLRQFKPDVILSTQEPWSLSNLQALRLSKALRAPLVFQTNQNIYKRYPFPFSWLEALSYRNASVALAFSEEARQVMLRKGLRQPSAVVAYGTDTTMFTPGASPLRERLGLSQSLVIGYMGRLVPEKGLDTLVQALALIRRDAPTADVKVLLVGSGPTEESLRRQAADAGVSEAIVFAGAVPHREAGEYMRCMDVFALPSRTMPHWKEQFGRVIIEAMACHVPVVGSDSGQIPHLIRETGGGLVFPEGNAAALAAQLSSLIHDPELRHRLGQTGGEAVRSRYTYEAVARQLFGILQRIVKAENVHESGDDLAVELSHP